MAFITATDQDNVFDALREAGMVLLRDNAALTWTDHNLHDPGITILESLCYALSELSLKGSLDIRELLGNINGNPDWPDFLDKTTLFNNALTETDYRKLLLGHRYARNAWVQPLLCASELYYDSTTLLLDLKDLSAENIPVYLRGLNSILFELETAETNGSLPQTDTDLNNNIVSRTGAISPPGIQASFEIAFPYWDEAPALCAEGLPVTLIDAAVTTTAVPLSYLVTLVIHLISGGVAASARIAVYVNIIPLTQPFTASETDQKNAVEALLKDQADGAPVPVFLEKMKQTKKAVNNLTGYVQRNRNLAEDFAVFKTVRTQEIAIEADLRIASSIPAEQVLARLYLKLDRWFTPSIPFYTEAELAAGNWPVEKIYEGPDLGGYFADEADFPRADLEDNIHISDLVGLFMQTDGVSALEEFGISNYINNQVVTMHERDCLGLINPRLYKPRFSRSKSDLRIFQDGILRTPDPGVIYDYEKLLAASGMQPVLPFTASGLQSQTDRISEIQEYYSIQRDFPAVYGLKEGELSADADSMRKAQSLQLKAYLVHFEQLMANHAAQLGSLKEIFSIDPGVNTTYPSQPLYQVPGIAEILPAFSGSTSADWTAFTNDPANPYAFAVANSDNNFILRRQRFLDHLLARLGHGPDDFTALRATPVANAEEKIISQKCRFIQQFPQTSAARGKACCYSAAPDMPIWDTDNVSGLEKRIALLLDIPNFKRRNLGAAEEGFFLIEHILLRPLDIEPAPAPYLLPEASYTKTTETTNWYTDPYSFRITVVFPALAGRFLNEDFQRSAERILALETPAHIWWDAYWITSLAVQADFENVLHDWMSLHSLPVPAEEPARSSYLSSWSAAKAKVIGYINHFRLSKYSADTPPEEQLPPYRVNTSPV